MNLTPEQAEAAIRHMGNGARISEAARMVLAPYSALSSDWTTGRADAEQNRDSDEASFYRGAQAARSRHVATARARAQAAAGTRESADLLAYVKALEAEEEPLGEEAEHPNAVRLTFDPDPRVREAAARVLDASDDLLRALVARDTAGHREVLA